ncbi:MAG: lipoprotein-releasing ABC transporter permease subunit [Pseudomonadota bacterium]
MFNPVSIYIGLRYTQAKRRNHFISFISLTSMLGIALGVTVLITVLSVMNGFDNEIRSRVLEMAPQVVVRNDGGAMQNWQHWQRRIRQLPDVNAVVPFIAGQGMLTHEGLVYPAVVNGIEPKQEKTISQLGNKMVAGSLSDLKPGQFGIILGQTLADNLDLSVGDKVMLVTPEASLSPIGIVPRYKRFKVVGIFNAGNGFGFDSQLAFIDFKDAQVLYQLQPGEVSGLRLKVSNFYHAPMIAAAIAAKLPTHFFVANWTQTYGALFKAIKLEKNMMFLILLLIVAVAAFNLVSTLVMVVNDKRADIAILRTFGATPRTIMVIFIVQGFIVGVIGTILGLLGGLLLASNVTSVVNVIEKYFHVQLLSSSVYFVNYLPSKIIPSDVIHICIAAFLLSLIATIYPAWRASRTQPAEALRYE